jgi:hypothetical protein
MPEQLIEVLEVLIPGPPGSPGSPTGNVDGVFITSGHIIQSGGTSFAQRRYLTFENGTVTDDPTNDVTIVTLPEGGGSGNFVASDPTDIPGATAITNMVYLSQASYDALSPKNASTLYITPA